MAIPGFRQIGESIRIAIRALAANKLRALLTMLGIIIGVASVILTVALGQGASQQSQEIIRKAATLFADYPTGDTAKTKLLAYVKEVAPKASATKPLRTAVKTAMKGCE